MATNSIDTIATTITNKLAKDVLADIDYDALKKKLLPKIKADLEKAIVEQFARVLDPDSYDYDYYDSPIYQAVEGVFNSKEGQAALEGMARAMFNLPAKKTVKKGAKK